VTGRSSYTGRRLYILSLVVVTRALAVFETTCLALAVGVAPPLAATRSASLLLSVCRLDKSLLVVTVSPTVVFTVTMVLAAVLPGLVFVYVTCSKRGAVPESKGS
jgi:hypothetical protein